MADAAAVDEKTPVAAPARAFPIKLLIIISVVALLFGVCGAVVAVQILGGGRGGGVKEVGEKDGHGETRRNSWPCGATEVAPYVCSAVTSARLA